MVHFHKEFDETSEIPHKLKKYIYLQLLIYLDHFRTLESQITFEYY